MKLEQNAQENLKKQKDDAGIIKAMHDEAMEKNNQKHLEEIKRLTAESDKKAEIMQAMYDEAMEETNKKIKNLEQQQENYLKIIQKKNYEATYPKPSFLANHQIDNPKAFYIQILGFRGAGKSTFLNRFFQWSGLRICTIALIMTI